MDTAISDLTVHPCLKTLCAMASTYNDLSFFNIYQSLSGWAWLSSRRTGHSEDLLMDTCCSWLVRWSHKTPRALQISTASPVNHLEKQTPSCSHISSQPFISDTILTVKSGQDQSPVQRMLQVQNEKHNWRKPMPQEQDNLGLTQMYDEDNVSGDNNDTLPTAVWDSLRLESPAQGVRVNASFLKANALDTWSIPTKCPSWLHTRGQCVQHASLCCSGNAFPRSTRNDKSWDSSQLFISQVCKGEWLWAQGTEDKGVPLHSTREDSGWYFPTK